MPAHVHLRMFASVLMTVIEFGTEKVLGVGVARIKSWRLELSLLVNRLDDYCRCDLSTK